MMFEHFVFILLYLGINIIFVKYNLKRIMEYRNKMAIGTIMKILGLPCMHRKTVHMVHLRDLFPSRWSPLLQFLSGAGRQFSSEDEMPVVYCWYVADNICHGKNVSQ